MIFNEIDVCTVIIYIIQICEKLQIKCFIENRVKFNFSVLIAYGNWVIIPLYNDMICLS